MASRLLRLDRVADALAEGMPLTAGGVVLRVGEAGLGDVYVSGEKAAE